MENVVQLIKKVSNLFLILFASIILFGCSADVEDKPKNPPQEPPVIVDAQYPKINSNLESQTVTSAAEFTLSVSAESTDGGKLSYQWYQATSENDEGVLIEKATGSSYTNKITLGAEETEKNIFYYVIITNTIEDNGDGGTKIASLSSKRAKITINKKVNAKVPTIIMQPKGYEGVKPDSYELEVKATSSDVDAFITYQWYKFVDIAADPMPIEGATSETYKLTEEELAENAESYFYCEITNSIPDNEDGGVKTQTVATDCVCVRILPRINASVPNIVSDLVSITVNSEKEFTLSVIAETSDKGNLSYKWYEATSESDEGTLLPDVINFSFTNTIVLQEQEAEKNIFYYVVITNRIEDNGDGGTKTASVTSKRAKVTVNKKINAEVPTIITQPVGYEGTKVDSYELTVTAETSDSGTLSYQWYKATDSTSEGTVIEGETSKVYSLTEEELEENNANYFYCVVTNTITDNLDGGTKVQKVVSNRVCVNVFGGIGFTHPDAVSALPFSPVDSDDSADSYGWSSLNCELGAIISGSETTFAVYSKNATNMLLEIYETAYGEDAKYDYWMEKGADNIWRAKLRDVPAGTLYAFRAWGPNWKFNQNWKRGNSNEGYVKDYDLVGNRFNPNKVLFDPYAKEISHDKSNPTALGSENGGMYGTGSETYSGTIRRNFDTGKYAPKAVVIDDDTSFGVKPAIPQEEAIIYEAHARGITKHPSSANLSAILSGFDGFENVVDIPAEYQGTYKGAGMLAPYLKALGVNTIELLPVHESDNDANPDDAPGGNYWAYMTYGYFAPDRRYSSDQSYGGPTREFKEMVKAFHDAGMEVYLDVVFNHSGEGGPWFGTKDNYNTAELTFMRGLDCSEYYCLTPGNVGDHWQTTGCGNNLQCDNPMVRKFILDSLTYWIDEMGVDGYRFDLAPVIGREGKGTWKFNQNATTIKEIAALGTSRNVEMIAEAWDCHGEDGYHVGNFPKGWGEWNGRFRDAIRGFVNTGNRGSVNDYINGDYNNFNDQGGPHKSVNFVVAHDGFTLADLCSYQGNGNAQNGILEWPFGPSDGGNGDYNTLGFGTEQINKRQAARNYIAIQMMSRGVPMIVWGDEFCRTQNGNNNPYNVDSVATWSNYNMINTASPHKVLTGGAGSYHNNFGTFNNAESINGNFVFMNYMLKLKAKEPALNQKDYKVPYNFKKEDGTSTLNDGDNCVWIHIDGDKVSGGSDYLVFMNMYTTEVPFTVPKAASGKSWVRIVDTQSYFETELNCWNDETADSVEISGQYGVAPWSVVILKEVAKRETVSNPKIVASGANANGAFAGSTTVTITCDTVAASIYYTTDGSEPSAENGTLYNSAIDVTNSVTIKAIALKDGCVPSAVVTKKLTNTSCVEIPVLSVPAGDFWNTITVFVTGATSGATYYYTTDGTEPSSSSSKYAASTGIKIDATTTLKVVGTKSGLANSSVVSAEYTKQAAQSYTENKSGVMLQGFNWDSAPRGEGFNAENPNPKWYKWYKTMKTYSDEIKNRFEYVWFPPASKTDTSSSEGYAPNELNNLNSCYGTEEELKAVVESIKPAKAIADIVVNHRSGTTSWGDFTNPKWNDDYYSICSDDEGFSLSGSPMLGSSKKGAKDSGQGYAAYRDLDHTNVAVQQGIYSWMNSVLKRAGFVGWRYDYVKGFDGKYVGYYNAMTDAAFSVGEYWPDDGNWKTLIDNWISATGNSVNGQAGKKSRAFDFVLKQNLNNAFGWYKATENGPDHSNDTEDNWNLALLADSSTLMRSNPSAAITFVDNHDTGSTQQHWELSWYDVPVAYAYILTHPGMPCVASQHYFAEDGWQYRGAETVPGTTKTMKEHIDYLIQLRQDLGIEYDDTVNVLASSKTNYVAKIAGTNGEIIVKIGGDAYTPTGTGYTGNYPIYSGTNFAIWQKGNAGVEPVKIKVVLSATKDVGSGNAVYFTGAFDEAENWKKAVRGEWSDGNVWKATVTITEGQSFDWKALKGSWSNETIVPITGDNWEWQSGSNNTYPTTTSVTF